MLIPRFRVGLILIALFASFAVVGCGHSEDEWQQAQRDIAKLKADLDAANKRHADDEQKYTEAQQQIEDLRLKLKDSGSAFRAPKKRNPSSARPCPSTKLD